MSYLNAWHSVPVNKSNRPFLTDNEHNVFVKDGVGIYQGKSKIKDFQDGRVYLTNKRVIYLDSIDQKRALAISLIDVSDAEHSEKFLRSSPKVKVFLKVSEVEEPAALKNKESTDIPSNSKSERIVDWVCSICSFNNHMSTTIDLTKNFPKCVSCGVPPPKTQLEEVLRLASLASRDSGSSRSSDTTTADMCRKCTFINHPSLRNCELCGAPLKQVSNSIMKEIQALTPDKNSSSNPLGLVLEDKEIYTNDTPYVKFSFRKGGDRKFFEYLKQQIDKIKWEALEARGGVSDKASKLINSSESTPKIEFKGIQGLEKLSEFQRRHNEEVLSSSLEGLEQLMHKAQDILQLTSNFSSLVRKPHLKPRALTPLVINKGSSIYIQELARHICEYTLNFELTKSTSMITSQDLFASYNRYSILSQGFGGELVSTQTFQKCLQYFDTLNLPLKLKSFSSGLVVITQKLHNQQNIYQIIKDYLIDEENRFMYNKFRSQLLADNDGYMQETYRTFHGKTVADIADHFKWSSSICAEELAQCMAEGLIVYDKHISGTFYFVNKFDKGLSANLENEEVLKEKAQQNVLDEQAKISSEMRSRHKREQNLLLFDEYDFGISENPTSISEAETEAEGNPSTNGEFSESLELLTGLKF